VLRRQTDEGVCQHADGGLLVVARHEQVRAALAGKHGGHRLPDGHRRADPGAGRHAPLAPRRRCQQLAEARVLAGIGGLVALEDDSRRQCADPLARPFSQTLQQRFALLVRQPHHLERVVALVEAVGVVVDRLARPAQQPGGGVLFAEDQVGVGVAALQGDPHRHLADGAPRNRVGPGQGLRSEQHVDPECPALAHQPVQEQGGGLGDAVVFDEQLLELVDDQQDARHPGPRLCRAEGLDVLHAPLAEQVAALAELQVEALQHAEAEFPLALDGDDAGVGKLRLGIGLELDPLLEVDQVELDLVRAVAEGHVGDQDVQQGRLARPRLPRNQHVLGRPLAELEVLELGHAGAPQRHVDPPRALGRPPLVRLRGDPLEGELDPPGVPRLASHAPHQVGELPRGRRAVQEQPERTEIGVLPDEPPAGPTQQDRVPLQVGGLELARQGQRRVAAQQRVDAAAGAAGHDARQPACGRLREIGREVGHHQDPVRLRQLPGRLVELVEGGELVAQIHLDHVLHVLRQLPETPLDVGRLGPDPAGHKLLVVVRQVHEGGEVLAQPDRVQDQESHLARRERREHAEHHALDRLDRLGAPLAPGLQEHQRSLAKGEQNGERELRAGGHESRILRQGPFEVAQAQLQAPQRNGRRDARRRPPLATSRRVPIGKQAPAHGVHVVNVCLELLDAPKPSLGHRRPLLLELRLPRRRGAREPSPQVAGLLLVTLVELLELLGKPLVELAALAVVAGRNRGAARGENRLRLLHRLLFLGLQLGRRAGMLLGRPLDLRAQLRRDRRALPLPVCLDRFPGGAPSQGGLVQGSPHGRAGLVRLVRGPVAEPAEGPLEQPRLDLGVQTRHLRPGQVHPLGEALERRTLRGRAGPLRHRRAAPPPATRQRLLRLLPDRAELLVQLGQLGLGLLEPGIQSVLGALEDRCGLPLPLLEPLACRGLGDLHADQDLAAGGVVFLLQRALVRLEPRDDLAPQRQVFRFRLRLVALIAGGELLLRLVVLALRRLALGRQLRAEALLGRGTLGRQPAQLDHQVPQPARSQRFTHLTNTPAPLWRAPRPDDAWHRAPA